jgi:hypothetical protein
MSRRFYGIAEIAEALGIDRQLVTVWRRRSSHAMPPPDDELSSGPLWTAATIEPWIAATRARLAAEAGERAGAPEPTLVRQAVRRLFRLVALLLEDDPRPDVLTRARHDLGRSHATLAAAARGMPELVAVARTSQGAEASREDLLAECLRAVPQAIKLLART